MALYRINDFSPNYHNRLDAQAIAGYRLYSDGKKIGFVADVVVNESGQFRYLVINPSTWIFGKQVLLPIERAWIDADTRQVFAHGLTREQVKALPEFTDTTIIDADYEAQVRRFYSGKSKE